MYLGRRLITVPRGLRHGRTYDAVTLARTRHDALLFSDRVVAVVMSLWIASGIAFPVALSVITGGEIDTRAATHFVTSMVVCGAIAVAYPFFFVAFYTVRSLYPAVLPHVSTDATDARELEGLHRRSIRYLAVAAAVPLVGVAGVTFLTAYEIPRVLFAVRMLSVGSIAAFVLVYWLFRLMEEDIAALRRTVAVRPPPGRTSARVDPGTRSWDERQLEHALGTSVSSSTPWGRACRCTGGRGIARRSRGRNRRRTRPGCRSRRPRHARRS